MSTYFSLFDKIIKIIRLNDAIDVQTETKTNNLFFDNFFFWNETKIISTMLYMKYHYFVLIPTQIKKIK